MDFVKKFRKLDGTYVDIIKHSLDVLNKYPTSEVYIGTDSQNYKRKTIYTTVIAFRYPNRGVHYIYNKVKFPRIRNLFQRLFKETEMSIEVADWFTSQININVVIDLDYNGDGKYKSNQVYNASKGWIKSLGYEYVTKQDISIASNAADYHSKK